MTKFLIDENVNQLAIRTVPTDGKGFDVLFPEEGQYKGAVDTAVLKIARTDQRVLVSQERDFGKFHLEPHELPAGAIWLRPLMISQRNVGELLAFLCRVLVRDFPTNPYDFGGKIIEVFPDQILVRSSDGTVSKHPI